ncbi:hypothetical protein [Alkalicoccus urumqiensis]|nr:hypothetical protein [Alkalicoccus urumqiensis]
MAKWLKKSIAASAISAAGYYLSKEENRQKVAHYAKRALAEVKGETKEDRKPDYYEKVGHSDPEDLQDNSMVDEGAQFSVNYYNENIKDSDNKNQQS